MTVDQGGARSQAPSADQHNTSLELASSGFKAWRDQLGRLESLDLPLLAVGAGTDRKAPANLRDGSLLAGWPTTKHSWQQIRNACKKVIAAGTRTGRAAHGLLVFDLDGETAVSWCLEHGCDPLTTSTWQIHRNTDKSRLKVAFRLSAAQQQQLGQIKTKVETKPPVKDAAGKVIAKGEAVELFHQGGSQVVVLGQHHISKGFYFWPHAMGPEDLAPIPEGWWDAALAIAGDTTTKTATTKTKSAGKGDWRSLNPCPICGRDTTGYCSQHKDGKTIRCFHGSTFTPPMGLKAGDEITDKQGTIWAFSKVQGTGDEFSVFVAPDPDRRRNTTKNAKTVNPSRPGTGAATPPASIAGFIHQLPDGWIVDEETGVKKRSGLSAGHLADLLEEQAAKLRFNELTMFVEVETTTGWLAMRDADMDSTYVLLSQKGWAIGLDPITKAICHVARQQSFHPVRQYLLDLEQDTTTTAFDLDEVAPQFFRSPDLLHVAMVRKWLIGAVARAMEPGCQMDYCLVLQSRHQGIGKTTSFKDLASPDWFNSTAPDSEKDFLLNVHSCWIFEMGELESHTGKRSAGHMKNLITITTDNFRAPYGRNNEPHRRGSVFCGTVNEESFLRDETGNRRYWVVPIAGEELLNRDGLKAARKGIWKAAMAAWRAGELPMLNRAQEALSEIQNKTFTHSDPWLEMLQAAIEENPRRWQMPFSTADVLEKAGMKQREQITRADETRIAPLLRQLGFDKGKHVTRTGNGQRIRLWGLSQPSQPRHNLSGGGCDTPEPLQGNDSQRLSQPSQPIPSKKLKGGGEQAAELAADPPRSLNVAKQVVTVVTPPANPLCRNGSAPSQPQQIGCDTVVTVVTPPKLPGTEPDWHQKARLLRVADPAMAYNTLALMLQTESGVTVTGRQVRELLEVAA